MNDLWRELQEHPGRFGLVVGETASRALNTIAQSTGYPVLNVSRHLTIDYPEGSRSPDALLRDHSVLDHIEVLFWSAVAVDPLRLLSKLARHRPVIAAWPGSIDGRRARFSEPGPPDHYDQPLPASAIVLRAVATTFPDQLPYEVERNR